MNPTMSTPSSLRRSNSSRASATLPWLVPSSSRRSRGEARRATQSNSSRQIASEISTSADAMTNTPRPIISVGTQK